MKVKISNSTVLIGVLGMFMTGCTSTARRTSQPEMRPLGAQYVTVGQENPGIRDARHTAAAESTAMLKLEQALALALLRNPQLTGHSHEVRAAEARLLQARLLPNPELEVELEEYDRAGAGLDSSETVIGVGQLFELGGKRRWRARMAEAEGELAGWDYESKRLSIYAMTSQLFTGVVAAQRRLELAASTVELARKTHLAVGERVKAGREPPLQASKAAAELELALIAKLEAESDLDVARTMLAGMWGAHRAHFEAVEGVLESVPESIPTMDACEARLHTNPDLARWDAEIRLRRAALSSEKAARVPDVGASVALQRFEEDGEDALSFGVGVPLPFFDRNQGNIAAAEHELSATRAKSRAAESFIASELARAYASLASSHGRALALRAKVVPAMEDAYSGAHEGYRQGKYGFLDMLDAQRGLFEARGALVNALVAYHSAAAEVERITGTSIEQLRSHTMGEDSHESN